ncbi:hypothetical protein IHE45_12G024600 [Dioscorea alata]|uniref:Uncharacterized protein n=1 Tax=Dioscorea alata TaxID=55571 RepID=A0ACB7V0M7_DIOAL|nr:hypothetical protein IHE45_12G024600 [Dioscorea alata]
MMVPQQVQVNLIVSQHFLCPKMLHKGMTTRCQNFQIIKICVHAGEVENCYVETGDTAFACKYS